MSEELSIRRATQEDAASLVEFNCALAQETEAFRLRPEIVTKGVARLLLNDNLGFYLVAEQAGEVVGCLLITTEWSDWRNGMFWWIQSVYVKPDYRRQGIYRRLYDEAQGLAQQRDDVCGFRLYVERDNVRAQQTYTSLGMSQTPYLIYEALNP